MRTLRTKHQYLGIAIALLAVLSACSKKDANKPTPQNSQSDQATTVARQTYKGIQQANPGAHSSTFHAEFAPSDGSAGWSFDVTTTPGSAPGGLRRDLTMDGLPPSIDPGDITLIAAGGQQYMIGEAVGASRCLLFPDTVNLDKSFLTPDDFLPAYQIPDSALSKGGQETVADQQGTVYNLPQSIGNFSNVQGSIVIAKDGSVLRYTLEGDTVDSKMLKDVKGRLKWEYIVTAVGADQAIAAPAECAIDLPVMPDAENLTKLPSRIEYDTASTLEEVTAFYQQELPKLGWGVLEFPQVQDQATVLTYALEGQTLSVSVQIEGDKRKVQLFTEDR